MSLYSDFQKDNNKKSGKSLYAKFKEKENLVKPTFTQRMTGEPVKQKDGTFKATTGVTDVLSGLPIIGPFARLGKTLGETMAYNELDDETREYLDKTGTTRDIVPDIDRSNLEIYADTAEAMTDAATGGLSSLFRKGALHTGKLASKELIKQAEKKLLASQIMKRFGIETGLNTASGYSFDVAQNARDGKKGADVFKPGIGTAGAALLSSVMGGRSAAQLQKANSAARITDKYAQKFNIPEAGSPFDNIKPKTGIMDNIFVNKPTEKLDINVVPGARYVTPEVTPKTPMESRALKSQSKNDFISNEIAFMNRTKQPLNSNFMKQVDSSWDKMHPKPIQEKIPTSQALEQMTNVPVKEIPQNEIPKVNIESPEFKQKVDTDTNWLSKIEQKSNDNDIKGFKQSSERYQQRLTEDKDSLIDYAMGLGDEDPKLPRTSANKLLARDADISGDFDLAEKLSFSSKGMGTDAAQELVGRKIFEEQTTADLLAETRRRRANKLGISENQLKAEEAKLFKEINEEMSKKVNYTADDLVDIISNFLC